MNEIIAAEHLRKTFGTLVAVDDLSFSVDSGGCFGILGPNGAGKTSTIRMVYGFSQPTAGNLTVFGLNVTRQARAVKARIGVCQQENSLDPELTVMQNLLVFARYFDIPSAQAKERSKELLKFMALDHRENARASELSGGMVRRIVMARALLNRPELLILDEPTTGLDPQSRHQVWERLEELRAKGLTILLTTHYMEEASRLCDRITYGSFVRMYCQKTFDAMMATPLTVEEIITGEIIWGATKSVIATAIMMVVISGFGLIRYPEGLLLLPLAFLGGLGFGAAGMFCTAVVLNIDLFNLPVFLFITPMFLFGGTFFPIENLPFWAQHVAACLPLTHLASLTRALATGQRIDLSLLMGLSYLTAFAAAALPLALARMRRRLIK